MLLVSMVVFPAGLGLGYAFAVWQCGNQAIHGSTVVRLIGTAVAPKADVAKFKAAAKPSQPVVVCTNTCPQAKNGVCDDGSKLLTGDGASTRVYCDLGTDCDDCGPWHSNFPVTWGTAPETGPIAKTLAHGIEVFARRTITVPPFVFAYTNPQHDVDVSANVHGSGLLEAGIVKLMSIILGDECKAAAAGSAQAPLFADVGSNFGFYTVMAAMMGCRVVSWEPVPRFLSFIHYNMAVNNATNIVDLRDKVVAEDTSINYTLIVPQRGVWGTAGIGGKNVDPAIDNQGDYERVTAAAELLDAVLGAEKEVLLLKVDVEGFEPGVMKSADKLTQQKRIRHMVMEYSPGVRERDHQWDIAADNARMLLTLISRGYSVAHLAEFVGHAGGDYRNKELPSFEEVVPGNLKHDIDDMDKMKRGALGCPMAAELEGVQPVFGCGGIPEHLHPKSFRSMFAHNTNIWISTQRDMQNLNATVGILRINEPMAAYTTNRIMGQGGRHCNMGPVAEVQHRCKCTDPAVCGKLEEVVLRLAAQGKLGTD